MPDGDSSGLGSGKGAPQFLQLTRLVSQETISLAEARRRAVTDGDLLSNMSLKSAITLAWKISCTLDIEMGHIAASLLCDWVAVRFPDRPDMFYETGRVFLATATQVLMERADAELYRQASPVAEKLVADARTLSDDTKLGNALIAASRFHLEPYAADPALDVRNSNFGWLRSLPRNRQERRAWKVHEEIGNEMPPHAEELDRVDRYLCEAAALLNGADRGYVLVHRAFALYSALFFEGSADKDRIRDYCYEAASLMPSEESDTLACARLLQLLAIYGDASHFEARLPFTSWSFGAAVNYYGFHLAVTVNTTLFRVMLNAGSPQPVVPLTHELLSEHKEGGRGEDTPTVLSRLRDTDRNFFELIRAHALSDDPTKCSDYKTVISLAVLRERAAEQGWRPGQLSAAILHAVAHHPSMATEGAFGLMSSGPDAGFYDLFQVVAADATMRLAADSLSEGDAAAAIRYLILTLSYYIETGYFDLASLTAWQTHWAFFRRHLDLESIGENVGWKTIEKLLATSDDVYGLLDENPREYLRRSWVQILAALSHAGRASPDALTCIMQALKGRSLAAALTNPGPASESAGGRMLLSDITQLEQESHGTVAADADAAVREWEGVPLADVEGMLGAFMSERELQQGKSAVEVLRNQYRQYQRMDTSRLMSGTLSFRAAGREVAARYRSSVAISRVLPETTLLASICFGVIGARGPGEGVYRLVKAKGFFGTIYDHHSSYGMAVFDPEDPAVLDTQALVERGSTGRGIIQFSEFGMRVAGLRRALLEDPVHRPVGRDAAEHLRQMASYFEPLLKFLCRAESASTSHLCIWPHQSLYFLPFQLLPWQDGIVADRFAVTVIPSLESLFSPSYRFRERRFLVVGCADGGVEYGLYSEPALHSQVKNIAEAMQAMVLVGSSATPSAVRDLVEQSEYVHIAAHGAHNLDAPAFHCLFLSNADGSNGRLYAHDILRCDLRGTELVTLSACESALFRYDLNDNLYGLAAAFLRAGARTVLGALWPVKSDTASLFFVTLYSEIGRGSSKLAAFRHAQSVTRAAFPEYRDWAAFILIGDWR
ncbi:CHAT domain-containing protein [Streptomyces akebiae]|uniref:CHAT domain-containing protein n=1 Tax=Streptomyces akebiae TaxID=2865673 RepID=A0ABX8XKF6_9ACTN|nr:CHAT domain-containing protein [Streptomyces akebiae]QYX76124.1 CHAT domain-containing protein [Streptomyces akebiae]